MKLFFSIFVKGSSSIRLLILVYFGLSILINQNSMAGQNETQWSKTEHTSVRLISSISAIADNKIIKLGLQFKMKPGWKIYWRSPGDAGYPPNLNWEQSKNLKKIDFRWPLPARFSVSGIQTIGYKKEVIFPINAQVINQTQKLELRADLDYLACNEICIPYKTKLALDIPPGLNANFLSDNQHIIDQYIEKIPGDGKASKLKIISVTTADQFFETKDNISSATMCTAQWIQLGVTPLN